MDDFDAVFREPEEVYLAAIGNTEALACRILDEKPLSGWERLALAAYLRGELKPPVRKRGQKKLTYLNGTMDDVYESILTVAVSDYHRIMAGVKKETGSTHKMKSRVAEFIAIRDEIDVEKLINRIDRSRKLAPEKSIGDTPPNAVRLFHWWLHRTGRLENYPRYIGSRFFAAEVVKMLRREQAKNDLEK
jgi:hypothetical protein